MVANKDSRLVRSSKHFGLHCSPYYNYYTKKQLSGKLNEREKRSFDEFPSVRAV